jgi:two-component system cell cycle response regulator
MPTLVLVVDDNIYNVKLLEAWLQVENFDVITAFSGEEALVKLGQHPPAIVLLDIMMPGMDGFEVCRQIRRNPKTARLPVVMLTALDKPSDREMGLAAGADDYLTKPIEVEALFPLMRRLLQDRSSPDKPSAKAS